MTTCGRLGAEPRDADDAMAAEFSAEVTGDGGVLTGIQVHRDLIGQTDAHALVEAGQLLQRKSQER